MLWPYYNTITIYKKPTKLASIFEELYLRILATALMAFSVAVVS
jgi:hypothetical protein